MNTQKKMRERGQTLVIVVMSMFVFLAFLALALDGGYAWAQRRKAQTAADAGALAGTRQLCITANASTATAAAQDYAVARNEATSADVTVSIAGASVEVTAHVVFNTFFAQILGRPTIDAQATAKAACFLPSTGEGVLPVAWSCRPPLPGGTSTSEDCEQEAITAEEFNNRSPWNTFYDELYLIMDSNNFSDDLFCLPEPGGLDCDLNDDGEIDVLGGGDRSWLDLNGGGGGASELVGWIEDGYAPEMSVHTWVPDKPGTANSIFQAVATRIGDVVILPVFDLFCEGSLDGTGCATLIHHGSITNTTVASDTLVIGSGNSIYVHVISFSGFGISCVKAGGVPGTCPAWQAFQDQNASDPRINNSFKSIEGYFIEGFVPGLGGGDPGIPDAGVYVLLLTK